ncbi:multidrug resistance-associated protein [Moesziomyces antarcticus T-34]|uniref:Multidrug resistance-associated protein n=1 Tax=Pseudozyma antarctica (strain T-34) TaxID=1151754 RepID=M9MHS9_PSEA3|nr:multidrug resistance-associated protein [Moesziomyces antarcticus T-34]
MTLSFSRSICYDGTTLRPDSRCRTLDFTVGFENVVLSILPNAVFSLLWIACRLPHLVRRKSIVTRAWKADRMLLARTAIGLVLFSLSLALLVVVNLQSRSSATYQSIGSSTFLAACSVSLATSVVFSLATWFERRRVVGGNWLLPVWLLLTLLFDAARLRTLGLLDVSSNHAALFALFAAHLACKCCSFVLESSNPFEQSFRRRAQAVPREQTATFIDRLGFLWLFPLLASGIKGTLTLDSLQPLGVSYDPRHLKAELDRHWTGSTRPESLPHLFPALRRTHALTLSLLRSFFPALILKPLIPRLILTAAQLALPFLISDTITFVQSYQQGESAGSIPPQPPAIGWSLAASFGLLFFVIAASTGQYFFSVSQASTLLRGALVTSVLDKCVSLDLSRASQLGSAGATNLLGVDVEKVVFCIDPLHELWSGMVTIVIGSYILWLQIGLSFLAPLVTTLFVLSVLPLINRGLGDRQKAWSAQTDSRLQLTRSILRAAQAIKMMAWENVAIRRLVSARTSEIEAMKRYYWRLSNVVAATNLASDLLMLVTFVVYALVARSSSSLADFNTRTIFTAVSTLNLISTPLLMIGQRLAILMSSLASVQRIQRFLEDQQAPVNLIHAAERPSELSAEAKVVSAEEDLAVSINFDAVEVRWTERPQATLSGITLDFPAGQLSTISGPTSCGKTTLLLATLGEALPSSGSISFRSAGRASPRLPDGCPRFGYTDQAAWVQETKSVRENIIFFSQHYDLQWFRTCLDATALTEDVVHWAEGDARLAKHLSGGQRQRVALARTLYASPGLDVVLLDDAFSALDARVETHILTQLFHPKIGILTGKTTVLVTNAAHIVTAFSRYHVLLSEQGDIDSAGPPSRLAIPLRAADGQEAPVADEAAVQQAPSDLGGSELVQARTDKIEATLSPDSTDEAVDQVASADTVDSVKDDGVEQVSQSKIGFSTYKTWFAMASYRRLAFALFFNVMVIATTVGSQIVLEKWAGANEKRPGKDFAAWITAFAVLVVATCLSFVAFFYPFLLWVVPRASDRIHRAELTAVLGSPLSYFHSTPLGRTLNRFSQDLFFIDWDWPVQCSNFTSNLLTLLGSLVLMVVSVPYLIIILLLLAVLSWTLRRLYMPSSRQLRRLEMASKSPLYTSCGDAVEGIAVLRAFRRQHVMLESVMLPAIDRSQRPFYYVYAVRRWLQVYLNFVVLIINLSLVLLCVGLRGSSLVALIGVSLSQTTQISQMINQCIVSWTEAEIAAVAIERVNELIQTPQESDQRSQDGGSVQSEMHRAAQGAEPAAFEFRRFWAWYQSDEHKDQREQNSTAVLTDVSLSIAQRSYTCVCGRSGSGKSTLMLAITRMLAKTQGQLWMYGRSIASLSSQEIRSQILVVPQQPFILTGSTIRSNLDVEELCNDDQVLWQALEAVQLKSSVASLDDKLEGNMFSPSQSQLFALARALVISKTNPRIRVLLLDEINSSLSAEADQCIQEIVRTSFQHLTVVSIVHRLDYIEKADKVLVLDHGRVAEFDAPHVLLADSNTQLYQLYHARNAAADDGQ